MQIMKYCQNFGKEILHVLDFGKETLEQYPAIKRTSQKCCDISCRVFKGALIGTTIGLGLSACLIYPLWQDIKEGGPLQDKLAPVAPFMFSFVLVESTVCGAIFGAFGGMLNYCCSKAKVE